jgi:hypothetical protein
MVLNRYGDDQLQSVLTKSDYEDMLGKYNDRLKIEARLSLKVKRIIRHLYLVHDIY